MAPQPNNRPATVGDIDRVHDRIDDLVKEVAAVVGKCEECRPKVLGNGTEGLVTRVTRLEQSEKTTKEVKATTWGTISAAAGIASAVATVISIVAGLAFKAFGG